MDKIGQEFYLPALHPRELWEASGRWAVMGDNHVPPERPQGRRLCLGMTEEEVMTEIARKELRSYKQLPQIWYQIQSKFRDEPRPKVRAAAGAPVHDEGFLFVRHRCAGLDVSYQKHYDAYCRIFDRCGLKYMVVEADSGAMGGSQSHEFMVRTPAGEDQIVSCEKCKYAANLEKATSKLEAVEELKPEGDGKPLEVHTPGHEDDRRCGAVPRRFSEEQDQDAGVDGGRKRCRRRGKLKSRAVVVLMRGDHQLNEAKLNSALAGKEARPMQEEEIKDLFRSPAGFLGPIGIDWAKDLKDNEKPILLLDQRARRPQESDLGRKQRRLSPEKSNAWARFPAYRLCRSAERDSGRGMPELWQPAADRYGGGNRAHLQARV